MVLLVGSASAALEGAEWGEVSFSLGWVSFMGESTPRLRIYYGIPYDQLRFISKKDHYAAGFYLTALCHDSKGEQRAGDVWEREVLAETYEDTRLGSRFFSDSLSFPIGPGEYTLTVGIRDLNSTRRGSKRVRVVVPDFRASDLAVSDLVFFSPGSTWVFNPERIYDGSSPLGVSFEIYKFYTSESPLNLSWKVEDQRGRLVLGDSAQVAAVERIKRETLETELNSLSPGHHSFLVSVEDRQKGCEAVAQRDFLFEPPVFFSGERYLEMVAQLQYIAKPEELKKLREAEPQDREALWEEFWKEKDPSPATDRNERQEEYFERVEYANRHFSSFHQGWKTDMGRVYIVYGKPDEIERHPFDLDSPPYEIWYYYSQGLRFIFLDKHNLGDYRLIYPSISIEQIRKPD